MAVYVASGAGSFVNGTTVVVDGGASLWRPELVSEEKLKAITASLRGGSSSSNKKKTAAL
jgi:hypothetical protein